MMDNIHLQAEKWYVKVWHELVLSLTILIFPVRRQNIIEKFFCEEFISLTKAVNLKLFLWGNANDTFIYIPQHVRPRISKSFKKVKFIHPWALNKSFVEFGNCP